MITKVLSTVLLIVFIIVGGLLPIPPLAGFLLGFVAGSIWYWIVVKPFVDAWLEKKYG